ncbi:hypothetical protein HY989_03850 [Candidatus Micrarchaeota archaeon]|nr:hypothetical protein [Candidatus Micrarchaeota archaeon]
MHARAKTKAQSSLELLIILSVGLVLLGIIFSISQQRINSSQQSIALSSAKSATSAISAAADSVYFEGVGAKRQVSITIPEGTVATSVTANSISMRLQIEGGPTDASANTNAILCSNSQLPTIPGTYRISVESLDGCVLIGTASKLEVSTTLIQLIGYANSTYNKTINYTNAGTSPITVTLQLLFASSDASILLASQSVFTLNPSEKMETKLGIDLFPSAIGSYSGQLKAFGSNGDNLTTLISISASGATCSQQTCTSTDGAAVIEIETYSSASYSQKKEIFEPPETIELMGGNWDPNSAISIDVRDPSDAYSIPNYPKSLTTNSTGGFTDSFSAASLGASDGYIAKASGTELGIPKTKTSTFDALACT